MEEKMKVVAGDSFFKSLKKLSSFRHRFIEMPWYNFKHGIKNIWQYRKQVWKQRPWDYYSILEMQQFELKRLLKTLEKGYEIDETRLPKVAQIERCIELIQNILDDDSFDNTYLDRVGYDIMKIKHEFVPSDEEGFFEMKSDSPYSDEESDRMHKEGEELKKKEINELFNTIRDNFETWWD